MQQPDMERSKDVYTVVGMLCLSETYRNDFFANPEETAKRLVGSLSPNEVQQLQRVAGTLGVTGDRAEYVGQVKEAFELVYSRLRCPVFPCPRPDPFV